MKHLCIIGNGFDLHHGISSSYNDYMNWLEIHYPSLYDEITQTFIDAEEVSWWCDFERHLADVEYMYDLSIVVYPDYEVEGIEIKGTNSPERLAALYKAIQKTFAMWAGGLNNYLQEVQADLKLDIDATYLTFNYTNTLQDVYHIPDNLVLHIHGKAKRGDNLIVGHGSNGDDFPVKQLEIVGFQKKPLRIGREIAILRKPVESIINANQLFFESLSNVEDITVYGFSFSSIDMPYIKEIFKHVKYNVKWHIHVRSIKEAESIEKTEDLTLLDADYILW